MSVDFIASEVALTLSAVACVFAFRAWWLMSVTTKAVFRGIDNFLREIDINEYLEELECLLSR